MSKRSTTDHQDPLEQGGSWPCRSTISCKSLCLQPGDMQQWYRELWPQQEVVGPPPALEVQCYKDPWQRMSSMSYSLLKRRNGLFLKPYLLCDGGRKCNDIIWGRGNVRVQTQPLVRAENRTPVPFYLSVTNIKDRQDNRFKYQTVNMVTSSSTHQLLWNLCKH